MLLLKTKKILCKNGWSSSIGIELIAFDCSEFRGDPTPNFLSLLSRIQVSAIFIFCILLPGPPLRTVRLPPGIVRQGPAVQDIEGRRAEGAKP